MERKKARKDANKQEDEIKTGGKKETEGKTK